MTASLRSKSSRDQLRSKGERLRRQGLRPIQIWGPDVRSSAFRANAHRQSLAVAKSRRTKADQDFIDAASDLDDFWNTD